MGKLQDLIVDMGFIRPKVIAVKIKLDGSSKILDFSGFTVSKEKGQYKIICNTVSEIEVLPENTLFLLKHILDKQIVDIDGRKLVRVNDLRLASLEAGVLVVAVDVGIEGLLRRLGIAKQVKKILKPFSKSVPSKLILWDEVETIDFTNKGIKLSKAFSKLSTLHPSDLADIIEDMDSKTQAEIFASLDEEKAADVLEELETDAKIKVLESLSVEKAADVLEKMPADEVADLLDEIDEDKAEELLDEMENEASEEVRELMEYPDNSVGSLMATDYISFSDKMTVNDTILELRRLKPESDTIYYLYVVDSRERLIGTVSLRDIIVSCPDTTLSSIMNKNVIHVCDNDKIDSLAEIISKYSLLAIPVVDEEMKMMGVVVIDDVVYDLMKRKKRKI
jgi:CBS domain-containing protein